MSSPTEHQPEAELTPAALFERLWDQLVGLISTPATAALMRRALKHASARMPAAALPAVRRDGLEYTYTLPDAWRERARADGLETLRRLVLDELYPLTRELTGAVIARHLARDRALVAAGLAGQEEP